MSRIEAIVFYSSLAQSPDEFESLIVALQALVGRQRQEDRCSLMVAVLKESPKL
jgi:hypothetical protein